MTDQERFEQLQKRLIETGEKFMDADKKLSQEKGFVDAEILANYYSTKKEWQLASNDYYSFLSLKIAARID